MPLLATMEMWWLGFSMSPWKMLLFLLCGIGVLIILEYYSGFRRYERVSLFEEVRDAISAQGIGFVVSAVVLFTLHLIRPGMALQEIAGKIVLQAIPVSWGVSVAVARLGQEDPQAAERQQNTDFWSAQAIALAGALLFGFNIAPTIEPMLLGLRMTWWSGLILLLFSLVQVHAIVYYVKFRGSVGNEPNQHLPRRWLADSVTTYALALLLAFYLLWTFGRIDSDTGFMSAVHMTIVLGFVTSLGAAAGKLLL